MALKEFKASHTIHSSAPWGGGWTPATDPWRLGWRIMPLAGDRWLLSKRAEGGTRPAAIIRRDGGEFVVGLFFDVHPGELQKDPDRCCDKPMRVRDRPGWALEVLADGFGIHLTA